MYHHMPSHLDGCPYTLVASHVVQLSVYCPIRQHHNEHDSDNRHNQTANTQFRAPPSRGIMSHHKSKAKRIRFLLGRFWVSISGRSLNVAWKSTFRQKLPDNSRPQVPPSAAGISRVVADVGAPGSESGNF